MSDESNSLFFAYYRLRKKEMQKVNISNPLIISRPLPAWLDLVLFKLSWIALVVFQAEALLPVLSIIVLRALTWREITRFIPIIALTFFAGLVMDSILTVVGVFVFPSAFLPAWLIFLWLSFAMTLPRGFLFVSRWHWFGQSAIGVVAGCAGYFAGYLLNAVTFGFSLVFTMLIIALLWAAFVPVMYKINKALLNR